MNSRLLSIFLCCISFSLSAQIKFEPGYIITDKNETIECFIKNIDWRYNPEEITYKETIEGFEKTINTHQLKEFQIYGSSLYQNIAIEIDKDEFTDERNFIYKHKDPQFKRENVLLKCLIQGKANLYVYQKASTKLFFFKTDTSEVKQLIYKRYLINIDTFENKGLHQKGDQSIKIIENNKYKQQLWFYLNHKEIEMKDIELLEYKEYSIVKFFIKYNKLHNNELINYGNKKDNSSVNIFIMGGINFSSLKIQKFVYNRINNNVDFGYNLGYKINIGSEFIAPFNNRKWALTLNPSLYSFNSFVNVKYYEFGLFTHETNVNAELHLFEIPMGIKYYMFLNNDSKIFLNLSYYLIFPINSEINWEAQELSDLYPINSRRGWNFACGYVYHDQLSFNLNYNPPINILKNYVNWTGKLKGISFTLGYNLMSIFK
jgi:hypothetical protein